MWAAVAAAVATSPAAASSPSPDEGVIIASDMCPLPSRKRGRLTNAAEIGAVERSTATYLRTPTENE